jgi:hypothetical protein
VDLGSAWLLPPTVTLQYHFDPKGASMRPYVGVGVNYTTFFGVDEPAGLNIDYDDSFGLALQAGIDIPFGNGWSVNVDVKKIYINTDVTITLASSLLKPMLTSTRSSSAWASATATDIPNWSWRVLLMRCLPTAPVPTGCLRGPAAHIHLQRFPS